MMEQYDGNILKHKKWCVCGDSFTHGDFTGLKEEEYILKEGRYKGCYAVYPYIIGNRNDMEIVMNAYNGATIAECGRNDEQTFMRNQYLNIPKDSDYITFYFGINDWHQNVPLGEIDSNDLHEFYGAWNVLLKYVLEKIPYAHVGIVVPNGTVHEYTEPIRKIARKWGIPYLDLEEDEKVPLMHRAKRTGVCEEALQLRMNHFRVNEVNTHPNPAAHLYESTFIESFLRTL